jgi:hypothetical protein
MSMLRAVSEPQAVNQNLLRRIRGEYLEMPGLSLTIAQAGRFWSLDHQTCTRLLDALVARRFLARTASGSYVLADSTSWEADGAPRRPVGADRREDEPSCRASAGGRHGEQ